MTQGSRRNSNYAHFESQRKEEHYNQRHANTPSSYGRKKAPNYTKHMHYIGETIDNSARELRRRVRKKVGPDGSQWLVIIFLVGCFALFFRKPSIFLLLAAISGTVKYLYCRSPLLPLDLAPLFFCVVMITSIYGLPGALLFIIVADFLPFILGGCAVSWEGFPVYGVYLLLGMVGGISLNNIASIGVTLSVFNAIATIAIYRMVGTLEGVGIFNVIMHMFLNITYFMKFAPLILGAI